MSGKFDERWCLDMLLSILGVTGEMASGKDVTRRLTELCPKLPVECITALRAMIEGSKEQWFILALGDAAKELIAAALHSGNPEAEVVAKRVAQDLIAKGHFDFRELIA